MTPISYNRQIFGEALGGSEESVPVALSESREAAGGAFDNSIGSASRAPAISSSFGSLYVVIVSRMSDWLARLPDDEHREIALHRMEGCSNNEIANSLNVPLRTSERRLSRIRQAWSD